MAPLSNAEIFNGKEIIMVRVEMTNAPIAYGAALNTKSSFFSRVNIENPNIRMILKTFSDKNKPPEIRFNSTEDFNQNII